MDQTNFTFFKKGVLNTKQTNKQTFPNKSFLSRFVARKVSCIEILGPLFFIKKTIINYKKKTKTKNNLRFFVANDGDCAAFRLLRLVVRQVEVQRYGPRVAEQNICQFASRITDQFAFRFRIVIQNVKRQFLNDFEQVSDAHFLHEIRIQIVTKNNNNKCIVFLF